MDRVGQPGKSTYRETLTSREGGDQWRGRGQTPPLLYYFHHSENVFCIFGLEIVLQSEKQHEGNIATILIKRTCIHIGHA